MRQEIHPPILWTLREEWLFSPQGMQIPWKILDLGLDSPISSITELPWKIWTLPINPKAGDTSLRLTVCQSRGWRIIPRWAMLSVPLITAVREWKCRILRRRISLLWNRLRLVRYQTLRWSRLMELCLLQCLVWKLPEFSPLFFQRSWREALQSV